MAKKKTEVSEWKTKVNEWKWWRYLTLHSDDKIFLCYIKNNFESIKPIGKLPFAVVGKSMLPLFVAFMVLT